MKKALFPAILGLCLLISACAPAATPAPAAPAATPEPQVVQQTVVVKETVVVPPTTAPEGPVTISFWHTYSENSPEVTALAGLISSFEASHPGTKVESVSVAYNDFRSKLFTAIAGGESPDIARVDIIWTPELAEMGALASLDDSMPNFKELSADLFPGPLSTNLWAGHYYGLPMDTNTKVWIYNKDLYIGAGITAAPTSMDEVAAQCKQFKAKYPDKYYFATDGMFAWVTLPWVWSFGGSITDAEITKATGYLNGPDTVAAYEFLLKMYKDGCLSPVILGNGIDPFTGYAQDMYASMDNGPWTYGIVNGQFPDKVISAAAFPAGKGGSIDVVGGEDVVLFKQSRNKAAAMEFLQFILSDEYQLKMAETGQIPVKASLVESPTIQNHPYLGTFLEQLRTSQARTAHPKWQNIDEILIEAGQKMLRGEAAPQAALDEAATKIDALLAQ
jgi:multiple sugar transport system substrate-binding protein